MGGTTLPATKCIEDLRGSLQPIYVSNSVFVANASSGLINACEHNDLQFITLRQALMEFAPSIATKILFYKQLAYYYPKFSSNLITM